MTSDTHEYLLLAYALAFDAGNFEAMSRVLHYAQADAGLEQAIWALHARFDAAESFTEQLLAVRASLVKKDEVQR